MLHAEAMPPAVVADPRRPAARASAVRGPHLDLATIVDHGTWRAPLPVDRPTLSP